MRIASRTVTVILALAFGAAGCAGSLAHLRPQDGRHVVCPGPAVGPPVRVTYLRTAGVLFRRGTRDVVMTAPFYSNPSLWAVGLGRRIDADPDVIRRHLPPVHDVKAILVGHAHYDHLMDVPEIAWQHAPSAHVYGNRSAFNLLHSYPHLRTRIHAVDDDAATSTKPGSWTYVPGTNVRFMPLVSEHAPHFCGHVKLFSGSVPTPRKARTAVDWREGQTLAYLIDFLSEDRTRVEYRVHYRDSASNAPYGALPPLPPAERHDVDLAVLCVASFNQVEDYPEWAIDDAKPRHILLAHWDDFFRSPDKPLAAVPLLDTKAFVARLPPSPPWTTLKPGVSMTCSDVPPR
jgi:L-ascorbate metabolism protein UlaG (beta-lactamase superfamily)